MPISTFRPRKKGEKLPPLKERLARIGLVNDWDYVLHLPLRYEDETAITPIADLVSGSPAQIEGVVIDERVSPRSLTAVVEDNTGVLQVRLIHFFPSQAQQLRVGARVRLYGEPRSGWNQTLEMVHPRIKRAVERTDDLPTTLTPVYPAGEGITQPWLRKRIARALLDVDLTDLLPESIRTKLRLPPLRDALQYLHHPPRGATLADLDTHSCPAWQRLKLDAASFRVFPGYRPPAYDGEEEILPDISTLAPVYEGTAAKSILQVIPVTEEQGKAGFFGSISVAYYDAEGSQLDTGELIKLYRNSEGGSGGGGGGNGAIWPVDVFQVILVILGIIMTRYFLCPEPKKERKDHL